MRPLGFLAQRLSLLPWPWFALAAMTALLAWSWLSSIDAYLEAQAATARMGVTIADAVVAPLMARCAIAVAILGCLLSAAGWVRDQGRMGDWLLVSPRSTMALVLGYWLTMTGVLVVMLTIVAIIAAVTGMGASIDVGAIASATLGLTLLACFVAALACLASTLSVSAVMAIALAAFALVCLWAPDSAAVARGTRSVALEAIALSHRISGFLRGQVALADIAFFAAGTVGLLLASTAVLAERRRWWGIACAFWIAMSSVGMSQLDALRLQWDWSADARYTLPTETRELLESIDDPVRVRVVGAGPSQQRVIENFFAPFVRTGDWDVRFSDFIPGMGAQAGVIIEIGDRQAALNNLSRQDVHGIVARLSGQQSWTVGYVTGQGERSLVGTRNHDLGEWGKAMELRNLRLLPVDVVLQPVIPKELDALIVPAMAREPAPGTLDAVVAYAHSGGQVLWLLDPGVHSSFVSALESIGIDILPGQVVDARYTEQGGSAPNELIVRRFPAHATNDGFESPLLLPAAVALAGGVAILESSDTSWNETGALIGALTVDGDAEQRGPLPLGVLKVDGSGRHVVVGDSDFISNQFVGNGGNLEWATRLVFHLVDAQTAPPARSESSAYRLTFGNPALGLLALLWLIVVPLVFIAVGAQRWRRLYRA